MKPIYLAVCLFGIIFQTMAQTEKTVTSQARLMALSDNQYTAGLIFLGTGTVLLGTSWAIPTKYDYMDGTSNQRVLSIIAVTGALAMITSIPLFLSAGQNARMAARLSLQNQTLYQPIPIPGQPNSFPSLSLKIPL